MKARFVKHIDGWKGDARLYKLWPAMADGTSKHQFVIVSAVVVQSCGPETYIFPATHTGEPKSFMELPGSFRGSLDHALALKNAGYTVVEQ